MLRKRYLLLYPILFLFVFKAGAQQLFRNAAAPMNERVNDLLHTLTLPEKISLLGYNSPAIERLQLPAYNWWNEALHGIARGGEATVYPQAIGLSATFNAPLAREVANTISTEARAKYNLAVQQHRHVQYLGLNFWTPNINIFRDPRWGRGQETYGEDPYLTATMAGAFVQGLQGDVPGMLKTAACAKHFAVHSGPEADRHSFNAIIDEKDLRETYLYAFKKLVDGKVESIMCAYNRVNSQPCCTGNTLLQDILRHEWKFGGQVVTDCWALDDIWLRHKAIPTREEVAAAAVKAGVNLDCANILQDDVMKAIKKGWLSAADVDSALSASLRTQLKLGLYDAAGASPYSHFGADSVNNNYHARLAREAARESMVLLKNDGILPLQADKYASMLVTGSNSASLEALMGNYHGVSGDMVTFAAGLAKAAGPGMAMQYDQGCDFTDTVHFGGIWASQNCDVTVAVIGLTPLLEGEEGDAFLSASGGDKSTLSLPRSQIAFMKKLRAAHKKPIVAVITAGSAVDAAAIAPYADAVILAWYPGEQGGNALADIIFGKYSPAGRLPVTFYKSLQDLPDYKDYSMKNRTYRYFKGAVDYAFGYGLSYTKFDYAWQTAPAKTYHSNDTIRVSVAVKNSGAFDGDEVVQAYISYPNMERMPVKELKAFKRIPVKQGAQEIVELAIPVAELQKWDLSQHAWKTYKGTYKLNIGKSADNFVLTREFFLAQD
ncbi:glycoside hydrolase family 3 N-terminal domain-containing protein [Chitinophaga sp. 22321]|uniref:Glycoside hydrolase family 3 C-terminal domain-containing protein n=1 Tax=Chitinophaga hostae TaxID=2831022 RepID=A0ABS5JAB1_9BACT|nr:glycoside hydrolase family 3 N-terminal domain-containing protein [Chitinophaga hostae]MBS0031963.1 glycoside hydrolase family 3 C-terminal domain-containing protein [Chitinophaga hostae]